MPRRPSALRAGALVLLAALAAAWAGSGACAAASAQADPRASRPLFVDPQMAHGGAAYAAIWRRSQAMWLVPEAYPIGTVRGVVRQYTGRAQAAAATPVLTVYGIPDRDCGQHSSGGLASGEEYRTWIRQIARGLRGRHALVVLEPDALPYYGDPRCQDGGEHLRLLRFASRVLSATDAWVYLDAGNSAWRPYDGRAALLKRAGIEYDRGFSTNVSNFRSTADERRYARYLLARLHALGVTGVKYVVDTSRNGAAPVDETWCNPSWARLGRRPRLVLDGAFDGTLWVKHPGESDGYCEGGPAAGQWSDLLADRLLGRS